MKVKLPLQTLVASFIVYVSGSHFRGGTISWRYMGQDNMVEFKFRLAWALGNANGVSWLAEPINGTGSFRVGSTYYNQTANSTAEDWEQGEGTFVYNFPSNGPYKVSFASSAWIDLAYGNGGDWNIETIVDLHKRSDTHYPNYSPITTSRAIYRVQFGCPVSIQIPMVDTDGDTVKCRWATPAEASSIYKLLPYAIIDENKCIITFTADASNNYTSNGWYAVAITIEDFPRKNITINGQVYTTSKPITHTPLQFLIRTETISATCDAKPTFVPPSPLEGSLKILKAASTLNIGFYVHSVVSLSYIYINGPLGLTKSSIKRDDQGRPNIWFVNVMWTPQGAGTNIICATAEDINRKLSETRCFTVLAWEVNPCDSFPCYNNGSCDRVGFTQDYTCSCDLGFTGRNCETNIDECISNPCQHGATCIDSINKYTCSCLQGYTGTLCEIDMDECVSNPCQYGATCTDHVNGFTCSCIQGYTGTHCEIDIDECISNPCQHGATCTDHVNGYTCSCVPGYTGTHCEIDMDECVSTPCQHGATCKDHVNGYTCSCIQGYTSTHCEIDIDECISNPCQHGATCTDHVNGYTCSCVPGYTGTHCEIDIDECVSTPCQHGATCKDHVNGYTCSCIQGYTSTHCEIDIDECISNPCQHGATCTDHVNGYTCSCVPGYTGTNCEIDIDECISNPCQHGATCTDRVNGYTCSCVPGYTGTLCDIDINECASSPCQHGGQCTDLINIYKCYCTDGYTGSNCQTDIDECISNPCQHGGICTDRIDGYTCTCVKGYTGTHCETDVDECDSNPCFNNGTCVDSIASWTCHCLSGFTGVQCQTDVDECMSIPCLHNGTCVNLINNYRCQCPNESDGGNCQTWINHCDSSPCLNGGHCQNQYGGYTCDCPDDWHGYRCEYKKVNKTDACMYVEYSECSCVTSSVGQVTRKSYKVLFGLIGLISGLLGAIISYIVWQILGSNGRSPNKIQPVHLEESKSANSIESTTNDTRSKQDTTIESQGPIHCDCFVDHTGYDHFQRYDATDNRFKFHNCRHKKIINKLN